MRTLRWLVVMWVGLWSLACADVDLPESGDQHVVKGEEAYLAGDNLAALEHFVRAQELGTRVYDEHEVWARIGNSYQNLDKPDKAIEAHDKALALDDTVADYWVNKGVSLRALSRYPEARKAYEKGLELNPDYAEGHTSLGTLILLQGSAAEAVPHFEKATALDPSLAIAWGNLAYGYAQVGRLPEAEQALERARQRNYRNADVVQAEIERQRAAAGGGVQKGAR